MARKATQGYHSRAVLAGSSKSGRHSSTQLAGNSKTGRHTSPVWAGKSTTGHHSSANLAGKSTADRHSSAVWAGKSTPGSHTSEDLAGKTTPVTYSFADQRGKSPHRRPYAILTEKSSDRHTSTVMAGNPTADRHTSTDLAGKLPPSCRHTSAVWAGKPTSDRHTSSFSAGKSTPSRHSSAFWAGKSPLGRLLALLAGMAVLLTCPVRVACTNAVARPTSGISAVSAVERSQRRHNFLTGSSSELGLGFDVPPPLRVVTVEGSRLLLPCRPIIDQTGSPNVTWTSEGRVVNDLHRHVLQNGTLLITKVTASDAGQYRCVLRKGTLAVLSAPSSLVLADTGSWQLPPRNTTVRVSSAVRLTCHLPSIPAAQLSWLVDGEPLVTDGSRFYQPSPGVLQITSVREEDAGSYRCQAVNPMIGKTQTSPGGYLSVLTAPDLEPGETSESPEDAPPPRPTLLAVPSKVEAEAGQRAVLECITDDVSASRLVWSRIDGRDIRKHGVTREGQGSLVFHKVVEQDAGVYNCSVISSLLRDPVTQMIELSVLEPPSVDVQPRMKLVRNGGSIVRLNCTATGVPFPEISWHKDGRPIPKTGRHTVITQMLLKTTTRQQLAISNIMANDSGIFQCIAKNRVGVASEGALLVVDLPHNMPGAPVNLKVTRVTSSSIEVEWDPPPSKDGEEREIESQGYVLHYLLINGGLPEQQCVTNNTSCEILKLSPYTRYSLYVRTFSISQEQDNHLMGEPSATIVVRTKANRPTQAPIVALRPASPSALRVRWTSLTQKEANGEIVQQKIQWRKYRDRHYKGQELGIGVEEYEIRDLRPNKRYEVRVLQGTESGYPEFDQKLGWVVIRMPSDVGHDTRPVVHLTIRDQDPGQIHMDWTLPEQLKAKLLRFDLTYNSSAKDSQLRNLKPSLTSAVIDGLEPTTNYTIRLQPFYKDGHPGAPAIHSIQTLPTAAHPPLPHGHFKKLGVKNLKVKSINSTCVALAWKATGKRLTPDFFTIKMVNLGRRMRPTGRAGGGGGGGGGDLVPGPFQDTTRGETDLRRENPYLTKEGDEIDADNERTSYIRITRKKITQCGLEHSSTYEITVTASTTSVTSLPSPVAVVTTTEGVPTAPQNASWSPKSPKDVSLSWDPPQDINGLLLYYLVSYSHDMMEWKNQTVPPDSTSTEIRGLISNTNYTLTIAGVTGRGVGARTKVYIYIRAILFTGEESRMSPKLAVVIAVAALALATCVGVVIVCVILARHRRSAGIKTIQGNGNCRYVAANGVRMTSPRPDDSELNAYQPMLTSLPNTHARHLDTKGGPGLHEEAIVANCTRDSSIFHGSQIDVPNALPPRDGAPSSSAPPNPIDDSLDDIDDDDDDDATSTLLQNAPSSPELPELAPKPRESDPKPIFEASQVSPERRKEE